MFQSKFIYASAGLYLTLVSPAVAGASNAPANPADGICSELQNQIEINEKSLSSQFVDEMLENSAPRATVEEGKINAAYQEISINLALMNAHRCAAYPHTISQTAYLTNALACQTDTLKSGLSSGSSAPDSCDRAKWSRTGK